MQTHIIFSRLYFSDHLYNVGDPLLYNNRLISLQHYFKLGIHYPSDMINLSKLYFLEHKSILVQENIKINIFHV